MDSRMEDLELDIVREAVRVPHALVERATRAGGGASWR